MKAPSLWPASRQKRTDSSSWPSKPVIEPIQQHLQPLLVTATLGRTEGCRAAAPPPNFVGQSCGHRVGQPISEGLQIAPSWQLCINAIVTKRATHLQDVGDAARSAPTAKWFDFWMFFFEPGNRRLLASRRCWRSCICLSPLVRDEHVSDEGMILLAWFSGCPLRLCFDAGALWPAWHGKVCGPNAKRCNKTGPGLWFVCMAKYNLPMYFSPWPCVRMKIGVCHVQSATMVSQAQCSEPKRMPKKRIGSIEGSSASDRSSGRPLHEVSSKPPWSPPHLFDRIARATSELLKTSVLERTSWTVIFSPIPCVNPLPRG